MRSQSTIRIKLSENMAKGGEYGNHIWPETTDEHERGDSRIFVVPPSTVDYLIDLTDLIASGTILALRSDKDISIRLNDIAEPQLALTVISPGRYAYFFVTGNVTRVYVSTGTEETQVIVGFAGDT